MLQAEFGVVHTALLSHTDVSTLCWRVLCRWLWCERLGHELADLAIEYHPLAESELINCTDKHFAKAERLHADLEKLVQQRRVDITASRRRMNNLVRELKAMNWVWSRGTDRLCGWQHDLELRALLEEVRVNLTSFFLHPLVSILSLFFALHHALRFTLGLLAWGCT